MHTHAFGLYKYNVQSYPFKAFLGLNDCESYSLPMFLWHADSSTFLNMAHDVDSIMYCALNYELPSATSSFQSVNDACVQTSIYINEYYAILWFQDSALNHIE